MTVQIVLDTAGWAINPATAVQWGESQGVEVVGLTRYLVGSASSICTMVNGLPRLQAGQQQWLEDLTDAGLVMVGNWELAANAPDQGSGQGYSDGLNAARCLEVCGAYAGRSAYLSNDSVVSNWANVEGYYQAANSAEAPFHFEADLYGQSSVFQAVKPFGAKKLWHAADGTGHAWPSGAGVNSPVPDTSDFPAGTVMVQRPLFYVNVGGSTCDVDYVIAEDFGGWNLNSTPTPSSQEADMYLVQLENAPTSTIFLVVGLGKHALSDGQVLAYYDLGLKRNFLNQTDLNSIPTV